MGTEILIVFAACGLIFLLIIIGSLYRRKKLEVNESLGICNRIPETVINGQRTFRIAAVSQRDGYGQSNVAVYEIRLPKINDPMDTATITLLTPHSFQHNDNSIGGQPPPPFCIAINMPSPISTHTFNTELRACDPYSSIECPVLPPTYNDVVSIARSSGSKLPVENVFV